MSALNDIIGSDDTLLEHCSMDVTRQRMAIEKKKREA
eukprot:SAG31_NODE_1754_length_7344_cov_20.426639_7_plen_37_part_00